MRSPYIREGICLSQVYGFKCESPLTTMFTASIDWWSRGYLAPGPSHIETHRGLRPHGREGGGLWFEPLSG